MPLAILKKNNASGSNTTVHIVESVDLIHSKGSSGNYYYVQMNYLMQSGNRNSHTYCFESESRAMDFKQVHEQFLKRPNDWKILPA